MKIFIVVIFEGSRVNRRRTAVVFGLLLTLGAFSFWLAFSSPVLASDTVYGYTAWEVNDYNGSLVMESPEGESDPVEGHVVEDEVACMRANYVGCYAARRGVDGERDIPAPYFRSQGFQASRTEYVYHDGAIYTVNNGLEASTASFERRNTTEVLDELAVQPHELEASERRVLEEGTVLRKAPMRTSQGLVEYDGGYYVISQTIRYSAPPFASVRSTECRAHGGPSCETAEDYHQRYTVIRWGAGLLGLVGIVSGAVGLVRIGRDWIQDEYRTN